MNYSRIYALLISHAQASEHESACEMHHIIPKSFGGSNRRLNLVKLSARQHMLAHLLLWKMQALHTPERYKMAVAVQMMSGSPRYEFCNNIYADRLAYDLACKPPQQKLHCKARLALAEKFIAMHDLQAEYDKVLFTYADT